MTEDPAAHAYASKKWYHRVDIVVALIAAGGTIIAAVIAGIFALIPIWFPPSTDSGDPLPPPRVELHSPIEGRVLGSDLQLTIRFDASDLNEADLRVEAAQDDTFKQQSILRTLQVSKEHRDDTRITMTVSKAAGLNTLYVRLVAVDEKGKGHASNVVQFHP